MKHNSKRLITVMALILALVLSLTACGGAAATTTTAATTKAATTAAGTTAAATTAAATTAAATTAGAKPYIAVVSKGFQHQFWQVVKKGADAAAAKYNVTITFEGPPSESDIQAQVQMLDSALAKKPVAIALAALSTESVTDQLKKALTGKIRSSASTPVSRMPRLAPFMPTPPPTTPLLAPSPQPACTPPSRPRLPPAPSARLSASPSSLRTQSANPSPTAPKALPKRWSPF